MDASDIRGMDDLGNLIEAARCLGLVQARKAFGQYGPDDAASERGLHASISERSARLRAEVEALTQQVNRLDDTLDSWMCAALPDGWIGALRAENERLKADAARYQWLRQQGGGPKFHVMDDANFRVLSEDLDDEIDAAMASGNV